LLRDAGGLGHRIHPSPMRRRAAGRCSGRVHSRCQRRLADAATGGRRVVIRLRVRWFSCAWPDCPAATFAGHIDGLTSRYSRRSPPLQTMLGALALAAAAGRSSLLA
jgi:hypothetical protein